MANTIEAFLDSTFSGKAQQIDQTLSEAFRTRVQMGLAELLEKKHLYQSVQIGLSDFEALVVKLGKQAFDNDPHPVTASALGGMRSAGKTTAAQHSKRLRELLIFWLGHPWTFVHAFQGQRVLHRDQKQAEIAVNVSTIRVACAMCRNTVQPHNPGYLSCKAESQHHSFTVGNAIAEVYEFPFQCQNCKDEPLIFWVARKKSRLALVGRSQFPEVQTPECLPESSQKFYRNALIADRTGFTLAAALYLRVLIEQHFYSAIPPAQIATIKGVPTGDELGELYAKTLPKDFPGSFPSLKKAYEDLSRIVHSGEETDETKTSFEAIRGAVEGHFEAVHLFKKMGNRNL